jgi:glycerol-3-phosphate dehydrogenase
VTSDREVVIIGGGVVGTAIARELCRYELRCTLLEAAPDVGAGTSKANTALLHTGFDAKPGSLEARLVRRGHQLLSDYAPRAGIPLERVGALLIAWNEEQQASLPTIIARALANGYTAIRQLDVDELYAAERHLGPGARGALHVPGEGILCPFTTTLALATDAVLAGCELRLNTPATGIDRLEGAGFRVHTPNGAITARYLVNAAGLRGDEIDRMLGFHRFTITPRRGQLIVFDKLSRPLVDHILLASPTGTTKGVLVSPTVYGNLIVGPTAEDVSDKSDTSSTSQGIEFLRGEAGRIVPGLLEHEVTAVYAGLRAATEHSDYQLTVHAPEGYACVAGIRSTGVSASLAIAEHVRTELEAAGLRLEPKQDVPAVRMPNIGESWPRPYAQPQRIAASPDYGRIVCFCERVTRGEIIDARASPIPPSDLDGLRRRTRALMGRCQGFFCGAEVAALLEEQR